MATREQNLLTIQLFLKALDGEKNIEIARKTLVANAFFDPYDLFTVLDHDHVNNITANDLLVFMRQFYPGIKKSSIDYAFEIMSKGGDIMTYDTFAPVITPRCYNKPYKNIYYMNKMNAGMVPNISQAIWLDFCNLVKCIHDEYLNVDKCCAQLQAMGVTGYHVYALLAKDEKGYVRPEDIQEVIEPFCHYLGRVIVTARTEGN